MKHLDTIHDVEVVKPLSETSKDLRYVLTQQCNYACSFCHKEWCDGSEQKLLDADDCTFIFTTARNYLWIQQVTLSWWEPMTRNDIITIAQQLHDAWAKTTLVSNGALLLNDANVLSYIDVLNLSLHNTQQELYSAITWSKTNVQDLIEGIVYIYKQYPHIQIKLNSAIIDKQNTPHTQDFLYKNNLASKYWWKLKYLELSENDIPWFVDIKTFEHDLLHMGFILDHQTDRQSFFKKDGVEIITWKVFCSEAKTRKNPQSYCKLNNDVYITPDWYISSCPMDIKKFHAYDAIISRDATKLGELLQATVHQDTNYACSFTS